MFHLAQKIRCCVARHVTAIMAFAVHKYATGAKHQAESIGYDSIDGKWIGECEKARCATAYKYLLFQGGGVKGIAYGAVVRALEDARIMNGIEGVSGASAGSQVAALVAAGYSGQELFDVMVSFDFKALMDHGNILVITKTYGFYRGDAIEREMDELLDKKTNHTHTTFEQLYAASCKNWHGTCKHLRIPAFCVNTGKLVWFDHESTPKVPVAHAVKASSSIPLFYQPTEIEMPDGKKRLFVDAGVVRNLPYDAFETSPSAGALGFMLGQEVKTIDKFDSIKDYVTQLIFTVTAGEDSANSVDRIGIDDQVDIVHIDANKIVATDFDLLESAKTDLLTNGYEAVYRKLTACRQDAHPGMPPVYAKIRAKPNWLQDLSRHVYAAELWKKLQDGASAFNHWWAKRGRPFFKPYGATVMAVSEIIKWPSIRWAEIVSLPHGRLLLVISAMEDPGDKVKDVNDVFLMRSGAQIGANWRNTRLKWITMPLTEGRDKILDLTHPARHVSLKFAGDASFHEHVCRVINCVGS